MTSQSFFVMIKPDGVKRGLVGEIISRFEKKGFLLHNLRLLAPEETKLVVHDHYIQHFDKNYYRDLIEFTLSGPIVIMKWVGSVNVARSLVGETIPWEAKVGTIRGDYASSLPANLVHCSENAEKATREVMIWDQFWKQ
jgi:nucleoside-diphosphate kinase